MSNRSPLIFFLAVFCFVPLGVKAETIEQALATVWRSNPTLQAARQGYFSAGTDVQTAFSDWLPQASLRVEYGVNQNFRRLNRPNNRGESETRTTTNPWSASLVVNQSIFRGGQIIANVASMRYNEAAAFQDLLATEQNVLLSVVRSYYRFLLDGAIVRLNRNNVSIFKKRLLETRNRFRVGEGTRTLVAFAEARLSAAQTQLAGAEAMLVASQSAYQRIVGRNPTGKLSFSKLPPLPLGLAQAKQKAQARHPQLMAAQERYKIASTGKIAAYGLFLPQVSIEGIYTQGQELDTGSRSTTNLAVTGRLSMPIFSGGRNFTAVRKAAYEAERARFILLDQTHQIHEAVANAWQGLKTAKAQIRSSKQQVKATRIALRGIRQQQSLGTSTFLDSLDAQQDNLNAQVSLETARHDEQVAAYNLLAASGELTGKNLNLKKIK